MNTKQETIDLDFIGHCSRKKSLSDSDWQRIAFQLFDCPDTLYNYTRCLILSKEYKTAYELLQQHHVTDCDDEGLLMNFRYCAVKIKADEE